MFGAIVYKLRTTVPGRMPQSHGHFALAAALQMLGTVDRDLATAEHDSQGTRNFSISPISESPIRSGFAVKNMYCPTDSIRYWRICGLNREIVQALASVPENTEIRIGSVHFAVMRAITDNSECRRAGIIPVNEFMAAAMDIPVMKTITFDFLSPVSFRVDDRDVPFPMPDLVFGSLASKFKKCTGMEFPNEQIKAAARSLIPIDWHGGTHRLRISDRGGITGFTGSFSFDMRYVDQDMRKTMVLLAEFANFSGTGRLTAQCMGETATRYR